jgi:hypothetical protein
MSRKPTVSGVSHTTHAAASPEMMRQNRQLIAAT